MLFMTSCNDIHLFGLALSWIQYLGVCFVLLKLPQVKQTGLNPRGISKIKLKKLRRNLAKQQNSL